jgi:bacteriocin biosynthesis cyclodehydratase domain-containing protein
MGAPPMMALPRLMPVVLSIALGVSTRVLLVAAIAVVGIIGLTILRLRQQHALREAAASGRRQERFPAPTVDPLDTVRPKMLLDSIFLPTEAGGVYFRSRDGVFTLSGKETYELVSELVPRFTGKQTVAELCEDLEPQKRGAARKLIATLLEKRIVINHVEEISDLSQAVRDRFATQIEFIEHYADNPLQRFTLFRRSRILLAGSGMPLRILALSLARNGLEKIILDGRSAQIECDEEFSALVKEFGTGEIPLTVERMSLDEVLAGEMRSLNAICYASDAADLRVMASINKYSCANQPHFLPGFLFGGKAFIGPLVRSGQLGCWMCALLRRSANIQPDLEALIWRHLAFGVPWENDGQPGSSPSLRILGNLVGFEMFRLFAGHIPIETDGSVLSIDLETLENGSSRLLPSPNCPHCSKTQRDSDRVFLSQARADTAAENIDIASKLELTAALVDPEFGIVRRFKDDDLVQLPLFQSAAILSRTPGGREVSIPGYSIQSNAGARLDALLSAMKLHVTLMPNRNRIWTGTRSEALHEGLNPLPERELSNWMGGPALPSSGTFSWMYARSFGAGTMHLVNAGAIYSRSPINTEGFEKVDAGLGVGFTFRQACGHAILSLFAHEVLKRAATHENSFTEIVADDFADANVNFQYLRNIFRHMDRSFRLLEFSHEGSGKVVVAFSPNDAGDPQRIAVGTAALLQPAVVAAMTDLLAMTIGGTSIRTAEHYLPRSLGYIVDFSAPESRLQDSKVPRRSNDQNMNSVLLAFGGAFTDIMIANLTDEDIRRSNLVAVKALFVRGSYPD